jgi:hypothetical protein
MSVESSPPFKFVVTLDLVTSWMMGLGFIGSVRGRLIVTVFACGCLVCNEEILLSRLKYLCRTNVQQNNNHKFLYSYE